MLKRDKSILFGGAVLILCVLLLTNCKKRRAFNEEDGQAALDLTEFRNENEAVISDANLSISDQFLVRGKGTEIEGASSATMCGMSMDTSQVFKGIITLYYNGVTCNNRKKEGIVVLTIQNHPLKKWKQKGCVLKVEYLAFKSTNTVTGKSVQLDGIALVTNESGGTWYDLKYLNQASLVHSITANDLKVRYGKDAVAIYSVGRRYTYTYSGNVMTCVMEGTGTASDKSNLDCWGQTRDGFAITSQVKTPLVWKSSCAPGKFVTGEINVTVDGKYYDLNCVFGSDADGNYESGNVCVYGWRLNWTYKRKTNHRVFGYN